MEGKPEGDDFNASLKTKNSNEVRFCVILEGTEGKVMVFGRIRAPAHLEICAHLPLPLPTLQRSLNPSQSSLNWRFLQEKQMCGEDTPYSFGELNIPLGQVKLFDCLDSTLSNTAATGHVWLLKLNKFKQIWIK